MCKECPKCDELTEKIKPMSGKKILCEVCQDKAVARAAKEAAEIFPHNVDDQRVERITKLCSELGLVENLADGNKLRCFLADMIRGK